MHPEFTTAPAGMAPWLVCLGCVVWIANQTLRLMKTVRGPEALPPNSSLAESNSALRERIVKIEASLSEVWSTMRSEDTRILRELQQFAQDIERAVGRLEGTVKGRSHDP